MVLMAIAIMVGVTIAHHLGLIEAIAKVVCKIAECNMCCTFWSCLFVLSYEGAPIHEAALLSILSAYASNWFVFLLMYLQHKYNELWQRMTKVLNPKQKSQGSHIGTLS